MIETNRFKISRSPCLRDFDTGGRDRRGVERLADYYVITQ
jgi:hypothetical protein